MFGSLCAGRGLTTSDSVWSGQPSHAVIVGLARPHPVTRRSWVTILAVAVGALTCVIPCREESAAWADRKVRLPLGTGSGISVQFQWGAEGNAAVARANIIHVARVTASAVLRVDQVDNVVKCCRLTPAFVPPVAAVSGKDPGKVTRRTYARARERCARKVLLQLAPPSVDLKMRLVSLCGKPPPPSSMPAM